MIKAENISVHGYEEAIRGCRNPLNSWNRSDSEWHDYEDKIVGESFCPGNGMQYVVGENDLDLMKRLCKAGTEHRKFMRMITVYMDVTAPLYWWKEADTYKVGTVANSCSTMHTIHKKKFELDDFSHEHLLSPGLLCDSVAALRLTVDRLNFWRERFNEDDESRKKYFDYNGYPYTPTKKECWWQMIQLLPSSYNQKRTLMLNYEVCANIIRQRKGHRLDEWNEFRKVLLDLPYMRELLEEE